MQNNFIFQGNQPDSSQGNFFKVLTQSMPKGGIGFNNASAYKPPESQQMYFFPTNPPAQSQLSHNTKNITFPSSTSSTQSTFAPFNNPAGTNIGNQGQLFNPSNKDSKGFGSFQFPKQQPNAPKGYGSVFGGASGSGLERPPNKNNRENVDGVDGS